MKIGTANKNYDIAAKPVTVEDATVSTKGGVLTIQAGDKGTKIDVQEDYQGLHVKVGEKELHFKKGEYPKGIELRGGKGDDDFNVGWNVDVPITMDGGDGNDKLRTLSGNATINGGGGKDTVSTGLASNVKITVGDDATVEAIGGHKLDITAGKNVKLELDADDSFVRVGSRADIFYTGFDNTFELGGMFERFEGVGTAKRISYPNENKAK